MSNDICCALSPSVTTRQPTRSTKQAEQTNITFNAKNFIDNLKEVKLSEYYRCSTECITNVSTSFAKQIARATVKATGATIGGLIGQSVCGPIGGPLGGIIGAAVVETGITQLTNQPVCAFPESTKNS